MAIPRNMAEYTDAFTKATEITGFGLDVCSHMPCPWCAFKNFMLLFPAAGIESGDDRPTLHETMGTAHRCVRCGRSGKYLIERDGSGVMAEFVQVAGPKSPSWLVPAPRRLDDDEG